MIRAAPWLLVVTGALVGCGTATPPRSMACVVTEQQLMANAERFVREHGYADALAPRATLAIHAADGQQWLVLFPYAAADPDEPADARPHGRVVRLDACGRPLRLERSDIYLDTQ